MEKKSKGGFIVYFILLALLIGGFMFAGPLLKLFTAAPLLSDAEVTELLKDEELEQVTVQPIRVGAANMGNAIFEMKDGSTKTAYVSDIEAFRLRLASDFPEVKLYVKAVKETSIWAQIWPTLLCVLIGVVLLLILLGRMMGPAGSNPTDFGKNKAERINSADNPIRFDKVAGLYEEKEEMKEIVEFLKNPGKFAKLGARIPKGILLVGPPGTGKTYMAKAVAGEAGVPFFSISGSDFVEMFVGVGASRVRDLFDEAKKNKPCIVFIDEIDAVGRHRGAGLGGSHDEREQTLNQLLVEMDGFTNNSGIIVLAATNRVDILDPALLRPGRFDRQVVVNRPDVKERREVLEVHSKNKPLGSDVDLDQLAQTTAGFTPADLESLMNEAAIAAAKKGRAYITNEEIQHAIIRVVVGTEKKSRVITESEKSMTAYHEAGHAILHYVLPLADKVQSVSVIPTGMAAGYTMTRDEEEELCLTKGKMLTEITTLLGGRVAEELKCGDITTGASNDIERATNIARAMVTKYGMSEQLGPIRYGKESGEVFLGRDLTETRNYGSEVAGIIDREIRELIKNAEAEAKRLLTENDAVLEKTHDLLMQKEKISGAEFEALFAPAAEETEAVPTEETVVLPEEVEAQEDASSEDNHYE